MFFEDYIDIGDDYTIETPPFPSETGYWITWDPFNGFVTNVFARREQLTSGAVRALEKGEAGPLQWDDILHWEEDSIGLLEPLHPPWCKCNDTFETCKQFGHIGPLYHQHNCACRQCRGINGLSYLVLDYPLTRHSTSPEALKARFACIRSYLLHPSVNPRFCHVRWSNPVVSHEILNYVSQDPRSHWKWRLIEPSVRVLHGRRRDLRDELRMRPTT